MSFLQRRHVAAALLALPITLAAAFAATGAAAGGPKTPLGQWMKPNMSGPLQAGKLDQLKSAFDTVAAKVPSGDYPSWASISQKGAAAAAANKIDDVKAACKDCHDQYKKKYLQEHATTPFP